MVCVQTAESNAPWFRASGLGDLIPVCIYAFIFHHSVPILAQPLRNKYTIRRVFAVAFGITCVSYVSIGFFVAYFFGSDINAQCNLNWRSYVGCMHPPAVYGNATLPGAPCSSAASWGPTCVSVSGRPASASIISFIVLIFPALDVLSAFPLNAITLGNNLMSACLGEAAVQPPAADADTESERAALLLGATDADADSSSSSSASGSPGKAGKASLSSARSMCATHRVQRMLRTRRGHRLITVCFRLVAAVPAVVGAAFVSNLDNILQFTGLIGIAIAFLIPAVLRVFALAKTRAVFAHVSSVVAPASTAASVANTLPSTRTLAARRAVDDTDALESAPVASAVEAAEKAVLEAVRSTNITWREALMHTGADKLFETPYSTWFGRGRIPEALFVASVGVAIYVFVVVVHHAATGSS
ncbi:hypothetical protein EON66_08905 [archaeon]|nr:MAG: hypothetical protein EON66_08905 [archaeon]